MKDALGIRFFWSTAFLTSRWLLWAIFITNLAGTVYGYEWYWLQLVDTAQNMPLWYLPFVPDSPTASLFFTCSLLYLLLDRNRSNPSSLAAPARKKHLRSFVEAFALITSFKYGIWAVSMIRYDAFLGEPLVWQDWMLTVSHLGMAAEALLFARFYRFGLGAIALTAIWVFWNDFMDYQRGVFPSLPKILIPHLNGIEIFTYGLSVISISIALFCYIKRSKKKHVNKD